MPKTILFDADGVTLKKQPYFSLEIARENNLPEGTMEPFFRTKLPLCQRGKADIKEELAPVLAEWKFAGTPEDYLRRWFTTDVMPDEDVLREVDELRLSGIKCCLASDQERYRGAYILDSMSVGKHFDEIFFSHMLGFLKSEPGFFQTVLQRLYLKPEEVMYFDDDEKNVEVAKRVGINAHFWTGLEVLKSALGK